MSMKAWVKCDDLWINMNLVETVLVRSDGTCCIIFAGEGEGSGLELMGEEARAMRVRLLYLGD